MERFSKVIECTATVEVSCITQVINKITADCLAP